MTTTQHKNKCIVIKMYYNERRWGKTIIINNWYLWTTITNKCEKLFENNKKREMLFEGVVWVGVWELGQERSEKWGT